MIDISIIEGCLKNDRLSQHKLYKLLFPLMISISFRYTKDRDEAIDYLNQGFVKVLETLNLYDNKQPFNNWVSVIIRNAIIDETRKNAKYKLHYQPTDIINLDYINRTNTCSKNEAIDKFHIDYIENLIKGLPNKTARVVKLKILGYSHKEIGDKLGVSESLSKWHLFNGRKLLKKNLVMSI